MAGAPKNEIHQNSTGNNPEDESGNDAENNVTPANQNKGGKPWRVIVLSLLETVVILGFWQLFELLGHNYPRLASVCIFISISSIVVYGGIILHEIWPRSKIIFVICVILCGSVGYLVYTVSGSTPPVLSETLDNAEAAHSRLFSLPPETKSELMAGGESTVLAPDKDGNMPLTQIERIPPLSIRMVHGSILFTANVTDGHEMADIQDNEIVSLPLGWDMNHDDSCVEIVNGDHKPVFQILYYPGKTTILVLGAFGDTGKYYWVNEVGIVIQKEPWNFGASFYSPCSRIFKYPSIKFPGQKFRLP
jgi:hypothetical protein